MTPGRYIVIRVAYDRYPSYGRSLDWIAPELRDSGLRMRAHRDDRTGPSCTWAGFVDEATFERFATAWRLDAMPHEPPFTPASQAGHAAMRAYTFDGMNWEIDGMSPIVYVSVLVDEVGR